MTATPDPSWLNLFEHLKKVHGPVMVLGDTDTGKSTLIRYVIWKFLDTGIPVALVDSDVGQSSLGLPGTVCSKVFRDKKDYHDFLYDNICYVGTVNPSKNIKSSIQCTSLLTHFRRGKTDITLIDTTGLIAGEYGNALKIGKIRSTRPSQIIALQRNNELEHILEQVENIPIHRLAVSPFAKVRTRDNRVRYRNKKLCNYFLKGRLFEILFDASSSEWFYNGKSFRPKENKFPEQTLIGLNEEDETLALGIITGMNNKFLTFITPLKSLKRVKRVVFGDILIESNDFVKIKNHTSQQ